MTEIKTADEKIKNVLPCPFCGSNPEWVNLEHPSGIHALKCNECQYSMQQDRRDKTLFYWNRRQSLPVDSNVEALDLVQDFKELNIYFEGIYQQGATGEPKDAGHLWIEFTDKFNAFKKKVLSLQSHPISNVEEAAEKVANIGTPFSTKHDAYKFMFIEGAKWYASKLNRTNENLKYSEREVKNLLEFVINKTGTV